MLNETCLSTARRLVPLWYSLVRSVATSIWQVVRREAYGGIVRLEAYGVGRKAVLALWLATLVAACGGSGDGTKKPARANGAERAPVESTSRATSPATAPHRPASVSNHTGAPRVLFLGTWL